MVSRTLFQFVRPLATTFKLINSINFLSKREEEPLKLMGFRGSSLVRKSLTRMGTSGPLVGRGMRILWATLV